MAVHKYINVAEIIMKTKGTYVSYICTGNIRGHQKASTCKIHLRYWASICYEHFFNYKLNQRYAHCREKPVDT